MWVPVVRVLDDTPKFTNVLDFGGRRAAPRPEVRDQSGAAHGACVGVDDVRAWVAQVMANLRTSSLAKLDQER